MELHELKKVVTPEITYSRAEIQGIFEAKTKHTLQKVNRSMKLDLLSMVGVTALLILIAFLLGLRNRYIISLEILGVAGIMYLHYMLKYRLLNHINLMSDDINQGLQKLIKRFGLYITFYKIGIPAFISLLYLYQVVQLWYIKTGGYLFDTTFYLQVGLAIFLAGASYLTVGWLVKGLYGRQLSHLKTMQRKLQAMKEG